MIVHPLSDSRSFTLDLLFFAKIRLHNQLTLTLSSSPRSSISSSLKRSNDASAIVCLNLENTKYSKNCFTHLPQTHTPSCFWKRLYHWLHVTHLQLQPITNDYTKFPELKGQGPRWLKITTFCVNICLWFCGWILEKVWEHCLIEIHPKVDPVDFRFYCNVNLEGLQLGEDRQRST